MRRVSKSVVPRVRHASSLSHHSSFLLFCFEKEGLGKGRNHTQLRGTGMCTFAGRTQIAQEDGKPLSSMTFTEDTKKRCQCCGRACSAHRRAHIMPWLRKIRACQIAVILRAFARDMVHAGSGKETSKAQLTVYRRLSAAKPVERFMLRVRFSYVRAVRWSRTEAGRLAKTTAASQDEGCTAGTQPATLRVRQRHGRGSGVAGPAASPWACEHSVTQST